MSTASPLETALGGLPKALSTRITDRYSTLKRAFLKGDFEGCGLAAGRFAEVMVRVLQQELTGSYTAFGESLKPIDKEADALAKLPKTSGSEGLRLIIPRALIFLYTLRNKRGIGHEGGDVDANEIDAATAVRVADWCLAELIRNIHNLSLEEAQALLDAIAERELPHVWSVAGVKRVLSTDLTAKEQVLLLLYSDPETAVPAEDLFAWIEYWRKDQFIAKVLAPLHDARVLELDGETQTVILSPLGASEVETKILPKINA